MRAAVAATSCHLRKRRAFAIAVLPLLLTACFAITPTFSGDTNPDSLIDATLYLSGSDTYVYQRSGGNLAISAAATNTSEETRQAYFPENGPLVRPGRARRQEETSRASPCASPPPPTVSVRGPSP
jgi:hypothetical protein